MSRRIATVDASAKTFPADILAANTGPAGWVSGSDPRLDGGAMAADNLSDLPSPTSARENLGLGAAAVLGVGTVAGTVAAGDDARLVGAVQRGDIVFNVKDYGAVGNGIADDTAAINACLNAALGGAAGAAPSPVRSAIAPAYFPVGTYRITATIAVVSALGLTVRGAGRRASKIAVDGTFAGSAVQFIGCPGLTLSDLSVVGLAGHAGGDSVAGSALALDWTPSQSGAWGSGACVDRVYVEDLKFKYGITLGLNSGSYDLSGVTVRDCNVSGAFVIDSDDVTWYQEAYRSGSGVHANVLNHAFDNCSADHTRYFLRIAGVNSVTGRDLHASYIQEAFYLTGQSKFTLTGSRIEETRRMLNVNSGGNMSMIVSMVGVVWSPGAHTLTDRHWAKFWSLGSLTLRDVMLEEDATANPWTVQVSTSLRPEREARIVIENVTAPNTTAESLLHVTAETKCRAEVRHLMTMTLDGFTGNYVTQRLFYNGVTADSADVNITT